MIVLRSASEIEEIRKAGEIVAHTINRLKKSARRGISTEELDAIAEDEILKRGGLPAFKNYKGFPGNICTSINEVVVHGIPGSRRLKDGDILSVDVGVKHGNYYADGAVTIGIGAIDKDAQDILKITDEALYIGIDNARPGKRLFDISSAIQTFVESHGYSVVRAFVGHGIGTRIHEEPEIPNYGVPNRGPKLEPGMVLAIEPMVNAGTYDVEVLDDGWTVVTKDRKLSSHFEHTIAIRDNGPQVLTSLGAQA